MSRFRALALVVVPLAVLASSCAVASESTSGADPGEPTVVLDDRDNDGGDEPIVVGACAPDVPNCVDTTVVGTTVVETTSTTLGTTPDTSAPSVNDPPFVDPAGLVVVYMLSFDRHATGPSPSLIPVTRPLGVLSVSPVDPVRAAVGFLLVGPTPPERESSLEVSTAIPEGTVLLGFDVVDGVATVNLSREFEEPSGSFSEISRLEQLVYTLTRFDEVDGIRLEIEGQAVDVFGGHGIVLDDPVIRTEFDTALPAVLIEAPAHGDFVEGPLVLSGSANVFEASVALSVADLDGNVLWDGFTTATCGTGCRGSWELAVPYEVDVPTQVLVSAWEVSAADGSQVNVRTHAVTLVPAP